MPLPHAPSERAFSPEDEVAAASEGFFASLAAVPFGQLKQDGRQVCRAHRIQHVPLRLRNGDHHPVRGRRHVVGDLVQRHLVIHRLSARRPTQRRQHHRQDVGSHERQAQAEYGRFGRAQRMDCRMPIRLQMLQGRFQRPALAGEIGHLCACHPAREVGQDMDHRRPIAGGVRQRDPHPPPERRLAVCIHHVDPLVRHTAGLRAATRAQRLHTLAREPPMFAGDEERLPLGEATEQGARTTVAVGNPESIGLHRLQQRAESTLNKAQQKEHEAIAHHLFHVQAQRFATPQVAHEALAALGKKWKYHQVESSQLVEYKRYATKGRPTSKTPIKATEWQTQVRVRADVERLQQAKQYHACFVLGSTIEGEQLSDVDVIAGYQGQAHAEGGCRFLKDPLFFVSSLFVKKPSRIQGLLMVMTLALLVYAVAQRRLRQELARHNETLPNQINYPTNRPTLRWVFQMLEGIDRVRIQVAEQVQELITGLTAGKLKILRLFGAQVCHMYQVPSG